MGILIAGNWKMNTAVDDAVDLATGVAQGVSGLVGSAPVEVAVCPPFVNLLSVSAAIRGSAVRLGAQNMNEAPSGAFTGEVSAEMLTAVGCELVILGHSERRHYYGEDDQSVNRKVRAAQSAGLTPIVCVGETIEQREAGREQEIVKRQLEIALSDIDNDPVPVIAYEPVWAIGTGLTATPAQAQDMHAFIRTRVSELLGSEIAGPVTILYGGSMKPGNALELLRQPDINGGLIGGASLNANDFIAIVEAGVQASS